MSSKPYTSVPMLPGPVTVPDSVLEIMRRDYGTDDFDEAYLELYKATGENLALLAETTHDVAIMTGEGMLGLWSALKSSLKPGDRVLSVGTGLFGDGLGQMADSLGCEVMPYSLSYNQTIGQDAPRGDFPRLGGGASPDLDQIEDAVRTFKPKMITAVHCETPSGTLNPLDGLGRIKKDAGVPLLCVDAVASWGGAPLKADAWNLDLVLGGSQKCLSAPPSMTFVGISPQAWEIIEAVDYAGYDALKPWRHIFKQGVCPYTPYWHGTAALKESSDLILKEGPAACFARHEAVAAACRKGLADLGIELFPAPDAVAAPTVTAAYVPSGATWAVWRQKLKASGLAAAGSFGPMQDKVFRLGHMGEQANMGLLRQALAIIADHLPG